MTERSAHPEQDSTGRGWFGWLLLMTGVLAITLGIYLLAKGIIQDEWFFKPSKYGALQHASWRDEAAHPRIFALAGSYAAMLLAGTGILLLGLVRWHTRWQVVGFVLLVVGALAVGVLRLVLWFLW